MEIGKVNMSLNQNLSFEIASYWGHRDEDSDLGQKLKGSCKELRSTSCNTRVAMLNDGYLNRTGNNFKSAHPF